MKPMLIDFADEGGSWRWDLVRAGTRLFLALLLLACGLGGLALQRGWQLQRELAELDAAEDARRAAQRSAARDERGTRQRTAGDEALLRLAERHLGLPWEVIFRAFETAPAARLISFEPDLARGVVKVRAHLADAAAVQNYLRVLQASPVFLRVTLLRHEMAEGGGVEFLYQAMLAAPYRLPAPEQEAAR